MLMRSLEDFRNQRYLTVKEFSAVLGISDQTYRRLLRRDDRIENTTRRHVAERLGVPPHIIAELVPPLSDAYAAAMATAIQEANRTGWYVGDPETGEPTDLRVKAVSPTDAVVEQAA